MNATFQPDLKIAKIADAYAKDAVDFAGQKFGTKLDWTDESIAKVEMILGQLRASMPTPRPPDEVIWNFAKAFGSYVGEVFRKNHGGEWGTITEGAKSFPGIRWKTDTLFWPWGRVHKRIVEGDENNVLVYYKALIAK